MVDDAENAPVRGGRDESRPYTQSAGKHRFTANFRTVLELAIHFRTLFELKNLHPVTVTA